MEVKSSVIKQIYQVQMGYLRKILVWKENFLHLVTQEISSCLVISIHNTFGDKYSYRYLIHYLQQ